MATLTTDRKTGLREIRYIDGDKRPTIRLGKMPKKSAEGILVRVEDLVFAKQSRTSPSQQTAEWVKELDGKLRERLEFLGLVAPREKRNADTQTVDAFIDQYLAERVDLNPSTVEQLRQVQNNLRKFIGDKLTLSEFNPGHADAFKASLASKLADNSVRRNLGRCRQFFEAAVRKRLLESNPFAHLRSLTVKGNAERFQFVTLAEIKKVIDAAPDAQWRLIIALARYGGIRTPSETLALKWSDIDWERQRIRVPSPKTAHVGKSSREIPLFPELLPYLQDAFELAADGTEYVVTRYRDATQNLRTTMLKIIGRAGLEPWERVFHNLRASRQTELAKTYPAHVVCSWMGNSEAVAGEHYLHTTEADFQKALENPGQNPGHSAAEMSEHSGTLRPAGNPETQKPRHFRGFHSLADTCTNSQLPDQDSNLE